MELRPICSSWPHTLRLDSRYYPAAGSVQVDFRHTEAGFNAARRLVPFGNRLAIAVYNSHKDSARIDPAMLIDYLRYVAFSGRLRTFFEDGFARYAEPWVTTGQHLRYAPQYLEEHLRWSGHGYIHALYWESHSRDLLVEKLKDELGISGGPDPMVMNQTSVGSTPVTSVYRERHSPDLEIVIDIHPDHWTERYTERGNYEGIPIIYRRSGPAVGDFSSGEKIVDARRHGGGHGTLCGIFCTGAGSQFALTCGHVAGTKSRPTVERRHRIWKFPLPTRLVDLGKTRCITMPPGANTPGPIQSHLDAALIEIESPAQAMSPKKEANRAMVKPISTLLQEEPVRFRGTGRVYDTAARISAVTIRKSMDLLKNGALYDVGDVLMLGHRHATYIVQRVSRPGDSGAAVRQDFSRVGPFTQLNQWYGMVLGSDESGAYASHAEYLYAWALSMVRDTNTDFMYET